MSWIKMICFVLACIFLLGLIPVSKGYLQMEGGLCLAWCPVVAKTQGYHLVCIWGSYIKFQQEGRGLAGLQ